MNYNDFCLLDFETTGVNPYSCQPIQLAAVMIHGRKLEIYPNSLFNAYIQPIWNEDECKKFNLTPMNSEITDKTSITEERLKKDGLSIKSVWNEFSQYVNKYNHKKSKWGAPIKAGMNIDRYDSIIIDRICGGHFRKAKNELDKMVSGGIIENKIKLTDPYGFGPWDNDRCEETLFFPRDSIDLLRIIWMWTENMPEIRSIGMDAMREWLGIDSAGAHNAIKDVQDCAAILIKFLKLHRHYAPKVKFKDSFK